MEELKEEPLGRVIFLPPFAISYEEARKNQLMQDQINEQRAKIRNWALTKSRAEIAMAILAWRKSFRQKVELVPDSYSTNMYSPALVPNA